MRVAHGKLRNLRQPRLDGVDQAEIADDPRKGPVRVLADAAQVIRRGRQVEAEIDAPQLVDAVQPVDPDRGLLEELVGVLVLAEQFLLVLVRLLAADAVGVVGLVVHHQDVLLAAHLAAQHAVDQRRVALHVADRFHERLSSACPACRVPPPGPSSSAGGHLPVEIVLREIAAAAGGRGLGADGDLLAGPHRHARLVDLGARRRRSECPAARRRASWSPARGPA